MRNILLAVVGLSPQVITETLFAIHQQGRKVDVIHIITTRSGKEMINAYLLSPKDGMYYHYLDEYGIDPASIAFGFDHIHTVKDNNGTEVLDIAGEEENEWLLKKCLELTFQLTNDPDTAVFFSIAGGRKTMSACLMVAAQFYGRPQDRIYHVLVSPGFENSRNFYYLPKVSVPIELKDSDGQPYVKETRYAEIKLVPIPFVSIRKQLSDTMLSEPKDPATLMLSLVRECPSFLTIDLTTATIDYKGHEIDIMPARLALYTFFALEKKDCTKGISCRACSDCYLSIQNILDRKEQIAKLYKDISRGRESVGMSETGILGLDAENFNSYKAKIRKDLERGFGLYSLPELAIESAGKRPDTKYGLRIDRDRIRMIYFDAKQDLTK